MLDPSIANVRISGPRDVGQKYIRDARVILAELQNFLQLGGITSGMWHRRLGPDAYCSVRVAENINVISIVCGSEPPPVYTEEFDTAIPIPDFLSGIVYTGHIEEETAIVDFKKITRNTLIEYRPTREVDKVRFPKLHPKLDFEARDTFYRLAVEPHDSLKFALQNPDILYPNPFATKKPTVWSQYKKLRPGFYSGSMCKLVQFIMGYGKIDWRRSIYGTYKPDSSKTRSPEWDLPNPAFVAKSNETGVQVPHDWRWFKTHGLVKSKPNKEGKWRWWLAEISYRGAYAMPLPMFPGTDTPEFLDRVYGMLDTEAITALETFGGFPSGEGFPDNEEELAALVRAGAIVALPDGMDTVLQDFYAGGAYSSFMGWAFSESGQNADNTMYYYHEDGYQRGAWYNVNFDIREIPEFVEPRTAGALRGLIQAAGQLHKTGKNTYDTWFSRRYRAALIKADRLTDEEAEPILKAGIVDGFKLLDELELETSIAPGSIIRCAKRGEDAMFWGAITSRRGPQFKCWDEFNHPIAQDGLYNHDFRPLTEAREEDAPGGFDTPIYVFYQGEFLHWVRFYGGVKGESYTDSTMPECPFGDSWSSITVTYPKIPVMFYTNTFDDREPISGGISMSDTSSVPAGHSIGFSDWLDRPAYSTGFKQWFFNESTSSFTQSDGNLMSAIATPWGMRDAYYYMKIKTSGAWASTFSASVQTVMDPMTTTNWRIWPGFGSDNPGGCGQTAERTVIAIHHNPDNCSDKVDKGDWASICDSIEALKTNTYQAPAGGGDNINSGPRTHNMEVHLVCNDDKSPIRTYHGITLGEDMPEGFYQWEEMTPDEFGNIQWITAFKNHLGDGDFMTYSSNINTAFDVKSGRPDFDDQQNWETCFIGVVHG